MLDRLLAADAKPGRRVAWLLLTLALIGAIGAGAASAELTQRGDLFVRFGGGISPRALPRAELAPIGVRIEGAIKVPVGQQPPSLRRIRIALNRAGHLDTQGLPRCSRNRLDSVSSSEALAACGTSLVGAGGIVARTALTNQQPATVRGEVLLFNGVSGGHPVILAHIYQAAPAPATRVIVFKIHRGGGGFGTVITGEVPPSANRNGHLESIFLQLERRYAFRGRQRSYLSAACSAPAGFPGATFPFARTSMSFDDGRTLSSTLVRSCRVK